MPPGNTGRLDKDTVLSACLDFFCNPDIIELICYCTRAIRLLNKSNMIGWQEKKLDGCGSREGQ